MQVFSDTFGKFLVGRFCCFWGEVDFRCDVIIFGNCLLDFFIERLNGGVAMKRFILLSTVISAFVVLSSCEKHEWDDTKLLHKDKAKSSSDGH